MTDVFANAAQTVLSGNGGSISAGALTMGVASAGLFPVLAAGQIFRVLIDSEYIIVTATAGTTWTITRGAEGSTPASHSDGALVTAVLTADALEGAYNVFVQSTAPSPLETQYLWIQTQQGDGTDMTFWVQDGLAS